MIAYLTFFAVAAPLMRVARRRRLGTALAATVGAGAVAVASLTLPVVVRLWLPFLYIAIGYWIPVPLVRPGVNAAFEAWLQRTDAAARRVTLALPSWLVGVMELGYLACFPLVPVACAAVWIAGSQADVARFWMAVLTAGFSCYGTLPWLVSRPPRLLDGATVTAPAPVARVNVFVLGRVSHHLNTFPSGHVAVSVAGAVSVARVWPEAGAVLSVVAAMIAIGAVVGRYHYAADVVIGAVLGIVVTII